MPYVNFPQPLTYQLSRQQAQNPTQKVEEKVEPTREYEDAVSGYRTYLLMRLQRAKEQRDRKHPEFSNKTYYQYYDENEKIANTYLEEVVDGSEKKLSTGTLESKLNTLLAHLNNLNLTPECHAFDKNNKEIRQLGVAFTDIMAVAAEHDGGDDGGDKEKRMARQRVLLKQGTVFVEENWITKHEVKKKLKGKYTGQFKDFEGYTERLEKVYEGCNRDVLYGPNVYLGDITAFSMADQPYIFKVNQMSYDVAKTLYGTFENWKFVKPGMYKPTAAEIGTGGGASVYDSKWRLTSLSDDQVEIIMYQDQPNDEYMILINGILMLPPGFPLSAVTPAGKYNIAKQTLYTINDQFAYGKSFVSSGAVYELSKALDRMLSLFELKTRKSITPPYINITNRVIPARVLAPGNITMGIAPNALQPIGNEGQGVTASEYQIFRELQDEIERATISATFQGQNAKSGATATEIIEVQRQARLTLGLIIAAATLLEVKIAYIRQWNLLSNWLSPIGTYTDGTNRYRNVSRETSIESKGIGERRIIPIDGTLPEPTVIRMLSLEEEQKQQRPVRIMYMNPKTVRESQITWYFTVEPKEEETSSYHKVLFRELVGDVLTLMQLGAQPNIDGLTDEASKVYNIDKAKIFAGADAPPTATQAAMSVDPSKAAGDRAAGNNMNPQGVSKAPQTSQKTMVN
jgi:hypothetical protein